MGSDSRALRGHIRSAIENLECAKREINRRINRRTQGRTILYDETVRSINRALDELAAAETRIVAKNQDEPLPNDEETSEEEGEEAWGDRPAPEDAKIDAAFPTRSGRHDLYEEAARLVGAKRSKFALIALVNWLLVELDSIRNTQDAEDSKLSK